MHFLIEVNANNVILGFIGEDNLTSTIKFPEEKIYFIV